MADYYNLTDSKLTFVQYNSSNVLPVPPNGSGQNRVANNGAANPTVKAGLEGMTDQLDTNYSIATGAKPSGMNPTVSSQVYDMDAKGTILNYPVGHPKYQPSFQDTRIQDALALQQQENTLFMIGSVAALSLVLLSAMIFKSQSSE